MVAKGFVTLPAVVVVAWVSPMVIFHRNIAVALPMATNLINGGEALLGSPKFLLKDYINTHTDTNY